MAAFDPHEHGTNTEVAIAAALVVLVALAGVLVRKVQRALGGA